MVHRKYNEYFSFRLSITILLCLSGIYKNACAKLYHDVETDISNELNLTNSTTPSSESQDNHEVNALKLLMEELKDNSQRLNNEIQNQIKVIRNATMFLITIVSAKGKDCPGIRDTSSKLRILHTALALQDPEIRLNIPEEILQTLPEGPMEDDDYNFNPPDYYDSLREKSSYAMSNTGDPSTIGETTTESEVEEDYGMQDPCTNNNNGVPSLECHPDSTITDLFLQETTESSISLNVTTEVSTTEELIIDENNLFREVINVSITENHYQTDGLEVRKSSSIRSAFRCPEVSKKIGNECFSLHLDQHRNWTSARSFCRSLGGDLAEPNLRNDRLPKFLLKSWPSLRSSEYWTLWVGATDIEKEGEWHWVTGGILDLKASSRWDLIEPPSKGEAQDCLAMILWVPGRWRRWDLLDDSCDLKWAVFCEYSTMF